MPANKGKPLPPAAASAQTPPIAASYSFSGPIPPPDFLKQYEMIVPGIAKRFLEEPRLEADHRRSLERKALEERCRLSKRGQWMAFILALICLAAAFTAIFLGYSLAGFGTFFVAVGTFAGGFIVAKRQHP